jgi:hypothetical protein
MERARNVGFEEFGNWDVESTTAGKDSPETIFAVFVLVGVSPSLLHTKEY